MAKNIINRLSEITANQIAAGEVVQRPSSVVKELMENAIDASSTMIVVGIRDGGRSAIQIIDDGCGMSHEDAVIAFERHATSKIKDSKDLYNLSTFGFRGEALPSIASVAEVELHTMRDGDELGTLVAMAGGELVSHTNVSCRVGTQFIVKNLFYNVPARRKFMKSAEVETKNILAEFKKIALCYPHISFIMHNNDKCVYNLPTSNLRGRVVDIVGDKLNKELIELYTDSSIVEIKGYVGRPKGAKKSPEQYLFINGRYFKSSYFNKAIISAYDNLLPSSDVSPNYFLYLKCNPAEVDVNIHPSKIEVKFEHEAEIFQIIKAAVRATLGKNGIMPMIDFDGSSGIEIPYVGNGGVVIKDNNTNRIYNPNDESFSFTGALFGDSDNTQPDTGKDLDEEYLAQEVNNSITSCFERTESLSEVVYVGEYSFDDDESTDNNEKMFSSSINLQNDDENKKEVIIHSLDEFIESNSFGIKDLDDEEEEEGVTTDKAVDKLSIESELFSVEANPQPIGETTLLDEKYIVTTIGNDIFIVDIKRAMSRIMYERYSKAISKTDAQPSHRLLFATTIPLQVSDKILIDSCKEDLFGMGFIFEDSDKPGSIDIIGVPIDMGDRDPYQLFEDILDSMRTDDNFGYNNDKRDRLIKTLSSITTNRKYSNSAKEDLRNIVETLRKCDNFSYSPSGKPITAKIGLQEIKKLLKSV